MYVIDNGRILMIGIHVCHQDAAEKLDEDATQYYEEESQPGAIAEAAKKIASMWKKMAQLIRSKFNIILFTLDCAVNL